MSTQSSSNADIDSRELIFQPMMMYSNEHNAPATVVKPQTTNKFVYVLTFFSAIGGFLFGYDTGVVSGAMIILKQKFALNNLWQELIVAITVGFAALFAFMGGPLNTWLGRRKVIMFASVVFTVGSIVLALASGKEMLLCGRAVVGVGIGLASMTVPMYIAEVSPSNVRGRLVSINNLFITGGQFVASCVDGAFSSDVEDGWRYMLGLAAIPATIQFIGFIFLPESPRWLIQKHKEDLAIRSLQKIISDESDIRREFEKIKTSMLEEQTQGKVTLTRLFSDISVRRAIMVGCALQLFQQISGINTVMYYSATIIQMSGVRNNTLAIWLAAVTAFVNFCFTIVGVWLVEKVGRRLLTLVSLGGVVVSLLFLSTGFFLSALHSPPVTMNSTDILNDTSGCFKFKSCVGCMQSTACGYCYTQYGQPWNVTQATCLPTNPDNTQLSLLGNCSTKHEGSPYFASNYCPTKYSWMALAGMILYLAFFAPGMGPMPWTINSEIYPQWARSAGNAFSAGTNWVFNVVVSLTFLDVTTALTYQGAFLLYAGFAFCGFIFIFLFLPETKGKPLEEVQELFQAGWLVPCRKANNEYRVILNQQSDQEESNENTLFIK
uniref:proton myo-inositol cotransporter-like isoform X1 n=2 Tax=Ciona intestinalis TaxID=7719 RepID=UPI00089DC259|nr:proton myo-inositol cotransporter-like isoform X1 [Ciona intestinalis]|eukprot:XP_018670589.1 proton myo-inositol cotransporter-like isoform X1 [Ciona intestinalis]